MECFKQFLSKINSVCSLFSSHVSWVRFVVGGIALVLLAGYAIAVAPPLDFKPGTIVRIPHGASVQKIAQDLSDAHVIYHPRVLRAILRFSGKGDIVQTGAYRFISPQNIFTIAYRLVSGDYGVPPVRVTFVEGVTIREAAQLVANALPGISEKDFLDAAQGQEGYLFPDTYFLQPSMDAESIVKMMHANFDTKMTSLFTEINASGHSQSDIVIMASLIEKEARSVEARRMVSGILWNRIAHGMPLQVDAVFGYIFSRTTYSPSYSDLKADSPYNTYIHKGLPAGPISNPGLDAIEAAANPTKTNFLYYLTGKDSQMHYATTYAQHQVNLRKYLQ